MDYMFLKSGTDVRGIASDLGGKEVELTDKAVYDIVTKEEYGCESIKEVNSIISRNDDKNYGATRDHLLGAISFGDLAFIAAPYEMFDTNGMQIKTGSPFEMTFIITNAGGAGAYVPSEQAVKNGGYEVYTAVDEFATYDKDGNVVTKGTAERMVDKFIEMLNEHKKSAK